MQWTCCAYNSYLGECVHNGLSVLTVVRGKRRVMDLLCLQLLPGRVCKLDFLCLQ